MYTLLDYNGKMPVYMNINEGSVGDNKGAYNIPLEKGSVIVAVRYYNDFPMLNIWYSKGAFFFVRHKNNLRFETMSERELPENTAQHIIKDEEITPPNPTSKDKYRKKLRKGGRMGRNQPTEHRIDHQQF
ncbi:MAG: hypothetical protein AAGF77_14635 [Bacteroidota bacterium]